MRVRVRCVRVHALVHVHVHVYASDLRAVGRQVRAACGFTGGGAIIGPLAGVVTMGCGLRVGKDGSERKLNDTGAVLGLYFGSAW